MSPAPTPLAPRYCPKFPFAKHLLVSVLVLYVWKVDVQTQMSTQSWQPLGPGKSTETSWGAALTQTELIIASYTAPSPPRRRRTFAAKPEARGERKPFRRPACRRMRNFLASEGLHGGIGEPLSVRDRLRAPLPLRGLGPESGRSAKSGVPG